MVKRTWKQEIIFQSHAENYEENMVKQTEKDRQLTEKLIEECNYCGYNLKYYFELKDIDNSDRVLIPIILKYIGEFDNIGFSEMLMRYLALKGFYEATETLLREFKRTDIIVPNNRKRWEEQDKKGYRESAAVALYEIKDKRFISEYVELIKNPDTHNDSYFIILLIGRLKCENEIQLLIDLLKDSNFELVSAAIQALANFKKHIEIIPHIKPFLLSDANLLKNQAKKTINVLQKN